MQHGNKSLRIGLELNGGSVIKAKGIIFPKHCSRLHRDSTNEAQTLPSRNRLSKRETKALAGLAQWIKHHPAD